MIINKSLPQLPLTLFILLNFSIFSSECIQSVSLQDASHKRVLKVVVGEKFEITSIVNLPHFNSDKEYDAFKWCKADHWKLFSYPREPIQIIAKEATAPDWIGGGALCQKWVLKAHEAGTFYLVFQRHSKDIIVDVHVIDKVS